MITFHVSIFSYVCDDYVSNDTENEDIAKVRQNIIKLSKDYEANSIIGQNEESSKDGSEMSHTSVQNERPESPNGTSVEPSLPDLLTASFTEPCDNTEINSSTLESSDIKPLKSTKVGLTFNCRFSYC